MSSVPSRWRPSAPGIVAWEYTNSNVFCINNCDRVYPEEPRAYAVYTHARVQCVERHIGTAAHAHAMDVA